MAHFHCRVRVGSVCKGAARVAFPQPKVGMTRTAYIATVAIAIRLKPHPTIRVLVAVEMQHVTELGYIAPLLLS